LFHDEPCPLYVSQVRTCLSSMPIFANAGKPTTVHLGGCGTLKSYGCGSRILRREYSLGPPTIVPCFSHRIACNHQPPRPEDKVESRSDRRRKQPSVWMEN